MELQCCLQYDVTDFDELYCDQPITDFSHNKVHIFFQAIVNGVDGLAIVPWGGGVEVWPIELGSLGLRWGDAYTVSASGHQVVGRGVGYCPIMMCLLVVGGLDRPCPGNWHTHIEGTIATPWCLMTRLLLQCWI